MAASHEPGQVITNFLKQRARVLGSTSECERVVACEKQRAHVGSLS